MVWVTSLGIMQIFGNQPQDAGRYLKENERFRRMREVNKDEKQRYWRRSCSDIRRTEWNCRRKQQRMLKGVGVSVEVGHVPGGIKASLVFILA